jgi:hypothetical protein
MYPKRVDGLLSEAVDNELLVFNRATDEAHALNGTAAAVFNLCDGTTDRVAMATVLAADFGLPNDQAVVDLALSELRDAGLVTADEVPEGISRRSVIRSLGLSVMAAAALPVIETMLASPAAALSSPTPTTFPPPPQPKPPPQPSPQPSPKPSPQPGPSPSP